MSQILKSTAFADDTPAPTGELSGKTTGESAGNPGPSTQVARPPRPRPRTQIWTGLKTAFAVDVEPGERRHEGLFACINMLTLRFNPGYEALEAAFQARVRADSFRPYVLLTVALALLAPFLVYVEYDSYLDFVGTVKSSVGAAMVAIIPCFMGPLLALLHLRPHLAKRFFAPVQSLGVVLWASAIIFYYPAFLQVPTELHEFNFVYPDPLVTITIYILLVLHGPLDFWTRLAPVFIGLVAHFVYVAADNEAIFSRGYLTAVLSYAFQVVISCLVFWNSILLQRKMFVLSNQIALLKERELGYSDTTVRSPEPTSGRPPEVKVAAARLSLPLRLRTWTARTWIMLVPVPFDESALETRFANARYKIAMARFPATMAFHVAFALVSGTLDYFVAKRLNAASLDLHYTALDYWLRFAYIGGTAALGAVVFSLIQLARRAHADTAPEPQCLPTIPAQSKPLASKSFASIGLSKNVSLKTIFGPGLVDLRKATSNSDVSTDLATQHRDYLVMMVFFYAVWLGYLALAIIHVRTNVSSLNSDYAVTVVFSLTSTQGIPYKYYWPFFALCTVACMLGGALIDWNDLSDSVWHLIKLLIVHLVLQACGPLIMSSVEKEQRSVFLLRQEYEELSRARGAGKDGGAAATLVASSHQLRVLEEEDEFQADPEPGHVSIS